jgi:putative thioredoxin
VIIDVTDETFQREVIERSDQVPVVVDLWASWCGPCRTLGPLLEDAVSSTDGQVVLAKVDTDANPRTAATFSVQSIPAVYALRDRKVVDHFLGARPAREVQSFVEGLLPDEQDLELAALVEAGDESSLRAALEIVADHPPAVFALAELLVADGRADEALELLERLPESAETRRLAALARHGDDAQLDIDATLGELLDQVRHDEQARSRFVELLDLLGPEDPRTGEWRKRLAAAIY